MNNKLQIQYIPINELNPAPYNPRKWNEEQIKQLKESIMQLGLVGPLIVNDYESRKNVVIGGHFRLKVAKDLGFKEVPVVFITISDIKKEKEANIRLNKALGDWSWDLLKNFDEKFLENVGFGSEA